MYKYRLTSAIDESGKRQKRPLFPLNIECVVTGFADAPNKSHVGYFRPLKNGVTTVFVYDEGMRIAELDHQNNPLEIVMKDTNEKWDFYY